MMHVIAIKMREINNVKPSSVRSKSGIQESMLIKNSAIAPAPLATRKPRRKPRPVEFTTPTTIPIAAHTAPTASAYFTPVRAASITSRREILCIGFRKPTASAEVMPQNAAM